MDMNTKKLKKHAFRVTKKRNLTASRVRVPGGHLSAKCLPVLQEIAEKYGNGTLHVTARQGFEIPDIRFEDIPAVNALLQPVIESLEINQDAPGAGYPASGTRNIASCIGNRVCPYGCYDTTAFAKRIEKEIFPNDLHFKVALTGCPNDCAKVRMHDFGIMGMTHPRYDRDRCVNCGACVKACRRKSTEALSEVNCKVERNHKKCIGCGECVLACPAGAWSRSREKHFRLVLMGRSGKKNPRLAEDYVKWIDADSIVRLILNTYKYVTHYIDRSAPGGKEHIGYIIDRTGFEEYRKWALEGVELPAMAEAAQTMYWSGVRY